MELSMKLLNNSSLYLLRIINRELKLNVSYKRYEVFTRSDNLYINSLLDLNFKSKLYKIIERVFSQYIIYETPNPYSKYDFVVKHEYIELFSEYRLTYSIIDFLSVIYLLKLRNTLFYRDKEDGHIINIRLYPKKCKNGKDSYLALLSYNSAIRKVQS